MDIKENNILITHCESNRNNPATGFLPIKFKLADFGISVNFNTKATNSKESSTQDSKLNH